MVILKRTKRLQIFSRPKSGLEAVGNVYFFKDIVDMGLDRVRTEEKFFSDFLVGGANSDQGDDFNFPMG